MIKINTNSTGSCVRSGISSVRPVAATPMKPVMPLFVAFVLALILVCLSTQPAVAEEVALSAVQALGKQLAFERSKGNCLACHQMADGTLAGNVAPPLLQMQARVADRATLREQIADARIRNPGTIMPPFETHGILSAEEVDAIVEYLYAL